VTVGRLTNFGGKQADAQILRAVGRRDSRLPTKGIAHVSV
jgi:hypothetical protein